MVGGAERQVVGIVEDGPSIHLKEAAEPYFYFPFAQRPSSSVTFFVEAMGPPGDFVARVRRELSAADPSYLPLAIQTMSEHMQSARTEETLTATIAGGLGTLGLLLSAAGLFGVTLFAVGRRMREFGVRVALGATAATLGRQVLQESSILVGGGLVLGSGLAYAGYRMVREELYGVSAWDAGILAAAANNGIGVAGLAGNVNIEPMKVLGVRSAPCANREIPAASSNGFCDSAAMAYCLLTANSGKTVLLEK